MSDLAQIPHVFEKHKRADIIAFRPGFLISNQQKPAKCSGYALIYGKISVLFWPELLIVDFGLRNPRSIEDCAWILGVIFFALIYLERQGRYRGDYQTYSKRNTR